jgi:hypothetical protein
MGWNPVYQSPNTRGLGALWGFHGPFNFIRKLVQMSGQSVKLLALGVVRSQVPNKRAFGGVFPQLFKVRLIILHLTPCHFFPNIHDRTKAVNFKNKAGSQAPWGSPLGHPS